MRLAASHQSGSVLIIVLWISFGLVSLALYFGHSMFFEFRAADNNVAGIEAEQAIEGVARYVGYWLTNEVEIGTMPEALPLEWEEVPVGDSLFWLIGRSDQNNLIDTPYFGLVDEASKLNLNTATTEMLELLPGMTPEFAAAIVDWRDEDSEVSENGAESEIYQRLNPAYSCKNSPFESLEELRLVFGADPYILYGEDYNRNGILDPNENDGDLSPPLDNGDGQLDLGIMEYVTVFSRDPNTQSDGSPRIDVTDDTESALPELLTELFGESRAQEIQFQIQGAAATVGSLLEFYLRSQLTADEFAQLEGSLTVTNSESLHGLINVNYASAEVLACVPGIGPDKAPEVVGARPIQGSDLPSMAWVTEILDEASVVQAGPYLTSRSYQFTADIAAVGHFNRGYRRTQFVLDTSDGEPKVIYRRNMNRLGWALGPVVRERLAQEDPLLTRRF